MYLRIRLRKLLPLVDLDRFNWCFCGRRNRIRNLILKTFIWLSIGHWMGNKILMLNIYCSFFNSILKLDGEVFVNKLLKNGSRVEYINRGRIDMQVSCFPLLICDRYVTTLVSLCQWKEQEELYFHDTLTYTYLSEGVASEEAACRWKHYDAVKGPVPSSVLSSGPNWWHLQPLGIGDPAENETMGSGHSRMGMVYPRKWKAKAEKRKGYFAY